MRSLPKRERAESRAEAPLAETSSRCEDGAARGAEANTRSPYSARIGRLRDRRSLGIEPISRLSSGRARRVGRAGTATCRCGCSRFCRRRLRSTQLVSNLSGDIENNSRFPRKTNIDRRCIQRARRRSCRVPRQQWNGKRDEDRVQATLAGTQRKNDDPAVMPDRCENGLHAQTPSATWSGSTMRNDLVTLINRTPAREHERSEMRQRTDIPMSHPSATLVIASGHTEACSRRGLQSAI